MKTKKPKDLIMKDEIHIFRCVEKDGASPKAVCVDDCFYFEKKDVKKYADWFTNAAKWLEEQ